MKKFLNALFLTLLAVLTFSSCSDVPAPYDILGEGDVPGLTGDGSKDNPYTVSDLKAKVDGTTVAWVQAYIVAGIKSSTDMSISSENDVVFGTQPTDVKATAFLIADDRGESDYKNCSAVNLSGKTAGCSEVKAALNLVDNATTPLPRLVTLKGTLVKNTWGLPGLKEVTTAILEDGTIVGEGGDEPTPPVGGVTFFEESFASDKGAFTIEDKTRPTKVSEIWKWESYTPEGGTASTYMKASAYISATEKEASESWLISPVVNLTKATKASLTFDHAHKFCGDPAKELTIWVKESTASDWTQATIPTYGTNQDWKFVSSGNIDLASYVGKNIQFAFKYISTTSNVGTWEVKNVKIVGEGEGGGETPEPPVEGTEIFTEKFGTKIIGKDETKPAISAYQGWDNSNLTFAATSGDIRAIAHKTPEVSSDAPMVNHAWLPKNSEVNFSISNIKASGYSKFIVAYEVAANVYNAGETADLSAIKVVLNDKEVVAASKVVSAANKEANIFYSMQVEVEVAGTDASTLKFVADVADNTVGFRLYNIRLYGVEGGTAPEPSGSELFISEYVESFKGNNKYVEIYNPTSESIDLSGYSLKMNTNGKKEGEEIVWTSLHNKAFTGTIEPGHVVVFANNQAVNYAGEVVKCSAMTFNGDDAIGLFKGETLIDLMGTPGVQEKFGENVVLRRVATVTSPNTTYTLAEWHEVKLTSAEDDASVGISGLGSHTVE